MAFLSFMFCYNITFSGCARVINVSVCGACVMLYRIFAVSQSGRRPGRVLMGPAVLSLSMAAYGVELDTVVVSSGDDSAVADVAQPVLVLDKQALANNPGDTLGSLLEQQPGISNASFGPGVGRPVLRGMSGSRVKMMVNGHDSADLSAMSSDHAPMAEAANARQVEVIQGPATLMYGGGAIGGVVNVIDNKIARQPVYQHSGELGVKFSSVDSGQQFKGEVNGGNGDYAWHLSGFQRSSDDYQAASGDTVSVSDSQGQSFNLGVSRTVVDGGFVGFSVSQSDYEYGVPNENDVDTRVKPEQTRYDLKSSWLNPVSGIARWDNELSFNDYIHDEIGQNDGQQAVVFGLFDQQTWEFNSRARHEALMGFQGHLGVHYREQTLRLCHDHEGCASIPDYSGSQWSGGRGSLLQNDFPFSHDTPMPETVTRDVGFYLVEKRDWQHAAAGRGTVELGARVDFRTIASDPRSVSPGWRQHQGYYADVEFAPTTVSAAVTWHISDSQRWAVSVARSQRAPDAQEMFWNGDHHATFSFQLDNPGLSEETAHTFDINWVFAGDAWHTRLAAYYYQFSDYIYNDLKSADFSDRCQLRINDGCGDPYHNNAVYRYEQADARFYGGEASVEYAVSEQLQLLFQSDYVSAQLNQAASDGNRYLPRTPPQTARLQLAWQKNDWQAEIENRWVMKQDKTATQESESAGYQHLNARLNYSPMMSSGRELLLGLQLNNMLDADGSNHVSYLKEYAPLPGRNVSLTTTFIF